MATKKFEERLDRMVEAAKGSEHPYRTLEAKPWSLSASIARTIVVGSGLSKSSDEIREQNAQRIANWREQGGFTAPKKAPKATQPKATRPKVVPVPESAPDVEQAPDEAIQIPDAVQEAVDRNAAEAEKHRSPRKRAPRKTGEASEVAKAIAQNREPAAALPLAQLPPG